MRLDRIDLNLFVIFEAIYRERSVTKVANTLNMTQSGVSNALRRLRETLGDPLFIRASDGMQPTPMSDSVIIDVRLGLSAFNSSISKNVEFDPSSAEKVFCVGMNDLAQSLVLTNLRSRVVAQAPKVAISTYYVDRQSAAEDLKSGHLDLLIDAADIHAKDLDQMPLMRLPHVVAMRPDHPLASSDLSLEDYLAADHIHVSSRRHGRGQADVALNAIGKTRAIMMRVQSYLVAANITSQSDLLWTVPRVMADKKALFIVDVPFELAPLVWNLYWSKSASDDPSFQWFRDLMADVIAKA